MKSFLQYITEDAVADQNAIWRQLHSQNATAESLPRTTVVRGKKVNIQNVDNIPETPAAPGIVPGGVANYRKRDLLVNLLKHPLKALAHGIRNWGGGIDAIYPLTPWRRIQLSSLGTNTPYNAARVVSHELQHVADSLKPTTWQQQERFGKDLGAESAAVPYALRHHERSARRGETVGSAAESWKTIFNAVRSTPESESSWWRDPEQFRKAVHTHARSSADYEYRRELGVLTQALSDTSETPSKFAGRRARTIQQFATPGISQRAAGRLASQHMKAFYNRPDRLSVDDIHRIITGGKWKLQPNGTPVADLGESLEHFTEIFDPKTTEPPVNHPDYEGVDKRGQHVYRAGVGRDGVVDSFFSVGKIQHDGKEYPNAVEAEFRVNDSWKKNDTNRNIDPREVFRAVHSHFDHFIRTRNPSAIFYDTADPVRHGIYQMAARRYGIPAINYTKIDTKTGSKK